MRLKAPAKINWAIDILGKREDGYHYVDMIMQQIELYDIVTIEKSANIEISCDNEKVPNGSRNTCYRAVKAYCQRAGIEIGARVEIEKNIPIAAGLAGGSSDAAAVLKALNSMYGAFKEEDLLEIGTQIGADVPFCIKGAAARATSIGEQLETIKAGAIFDIVLIKPPFEVSTKEIYSAYDDAKNKDKNKYAQGTYEALMEGNIEKMAQNMSNVLEPVTFSIVPSLRKIKSEVLESGAVQAMMSGSGPTIFGIYRNEKEAEKATAYLKKVFQDYFIYKTKTI